MDSSQLSKHERNRMVSPGMDTGEIKKKREQFLHRYNSGLLLTVPHTGRIVEMTEEGINYGHIKITANRPSDVAETQAFNVLEGKKIYRLDLHTDNHDGFYGMPHTPDEGEWRGLLSYVISFSPMFIGDGWLWIDQRETVTSTWGQLLGILPGELIRLIEKGVKYIRLAYGSVRKQDIMRLTDDLNERGFSVSSGGSGTVIYKAGVSVMIDLYKVTITGTLKEVEDVKALTTKITLCHECSWRVEDPLNLQALSDEETHKLYQEACQSGTVATCRALVAILGNEGVGKTSLVRSLLGMDFLEEHLQTNLVDIHKTWVDEDASNWTEQKENAEETETQTLIGAAIRDLVRTKPKTPIPADQVQDEVPRKGSITNLPPVKEETRNKKGVVSESKMQSQSHKEGRKQSSSAEEPPPEILKTYVQMGSNDNLITIWDLGGQKLFQAIHGVLMAGNTIYVLVSDVTLGLDKPIYQYSESGHKSLTTQRELLYSLLKIIGCRSLDEGTLPKLLVVCSKCDLVKKEEIRSHITSIEELLQRTGLQIDVKGVVEYSSRYPDSYQSILKKKMKECLQSMENEIPVKWLMLRDKLKLAHKRTWEDVRKFARDVGINKEADITQAMNYFHQQGEVIFFKSHNLRDHIITSPEWFTDMVKKIITIEKYQVIRGKVSKGHWNDLNTKGLLHDEVLSEFWGEEKESLIKMMEHFYLMFQCKNHPKYRNTRCYLVPTLLPLKPIEGFETTGTPPAIYLQSEDMVLPSGFSSALMVSLELENQALKRFGKRELAQKSTSFVVRGSKSYDVCIREVQIDGKDLIQILARRLLKREHSLKQSNEETLTELLSIVKEKFDLCQVRRNMKRSHKVLIRCKCDKHFIQVASNGHLENRLTCEKEFLKDFSSDCYKCWFEEVNVAEKFEPVKLEYIDKYRYPQSVLAGDKIKLHVSLSGSPAPNVTWKKNGEELANGNGVDILTSDRESAVEIYPANMSHAGKYEIFAKNHKSFFESSFQLIVKDTSQKKDSTETSHLDTLTPDKFGLSLMTQDSCQIQHPKSSILLTVHEGTVEQDDSCEISVQIYTDLDRCRDVLNKDQYFVTPIVVCDMSTKRLLKPVQIRMPHNLIDPKVIGKMRVYCTSNGCKEEIIQEQQDKDCAMSYHIKNECVVISTSGPGQFHCESKGQQESLLGVVDVYMSDERDQKEKGLTLRPFIRFGMAIQEDFHHMVPCGEKYQLIAKSEVIYLDGSSKYQSASTGFQCVEREYHMYHWPETKDSKDLQAVKVETQDAGMMMIIPLPNCQLTCHSDEKVLMGNMNVQFFDGEKTLLKEMSLRVNRALPSSPAVSPSFPEITYHESLNQAVVVALGGEVELEATIHGGPETILKWYHLNKEIHPNENLTITTTEEKTVLSITSCSKTHDGDYALKAYNSRGFFHSFFKISVFAVRPKDLHITPPPPDIFGAKLSPEHSLILKHPSSEITLTIPKGAVPAGVEDEVEGQILVDLNNYQHLFPDEEYLIAPIVDYNIRNKQFDEFCIPVDIRIPHCIIDENVRKNIKVYSIDGGKKPEPVGKDQTADLYYKIMEKYILISLKHFTKFPCTTHDKQCKMEAILSLYMASSGNPGDHTAKLSPKLLLGCATCSEFKGNVYLDPGMTLKSQKQFHFLEPHECLSISTEVKYSEPWKVLEEGSYVENIEAQTTPVADIFKDETEIPQVISLPEYMLSKSGGEKLSCTLHVSFQYKDGKTHLEKIQLEEDFSRNPAQAVKVTGQPGVAPEEQVPDTEKAQAAEGATPELSSTEDIEVTIKKYGEIFLTAFKSKLPKVSDKIDYKATAEVMTSWDILTKRQRKEIQEAVPTSITKIEKIAEYLENRTNEEKVMFAKALIETDQKHWLKVILSNDVDILKAINNIDLEKCKELRQNNM